MRVFKIAVINGAMSKSLPESSMSASTGNEDLTSFDTSLHTEPSARSRTTSNASYVSLPSSFRAPRVRFMPTVRKLLPRTVTFKVRPERGGGDGDNIPVPDDDSNKSEREKTPPHQHVRPGVYVRRFVRKGVKNIRPKLHEGVQKIKHGTVIAAEKAKPFVEESIQEGEKVTGWVFRKAKYLGVVAALKTVRLVTGLNSTRLTTHSIDDIDIPDDELYDPFEFEYNDVDDIPVAIPKLVIPEHEDRLGDSKNHVYFDNQKHLRYNATVAQATSKFTRELADRYKKGEIQPPLKEVVSSVGPRIHVGSKVDIDKQTLSISVIEASSLPGLDTNGLSDPYCLVSLRPDAAVVPLRTRTIYKTTNPKWKEVFELSEVPHISILLRQSLYFEVRDYDQIGSDDLIGSLELSLDKYDLLTGFDGWFELHTPDTEETPMTYGTILLGLRYEEGQERLTVLLEKCRFLEKTGWLGFRACLHVNGRLIKMIKKSAERTVAFDPEIKRRITFADVKKSLLDEYTVTIYFTFLRFFIWHSYFGQINLSEKSKHAEEQAIYAEMKKTPGETVFKEILIKKFVGVVRKPWRRDDEAQHTGYLNILLKTLPVNQAGQLTISCTVEKIEELNLPEDSLVVLRVYLVKDSISLTAEKTQPKAVGERVTPIEDRFDFLVENSIMSKVSIVIVIFKKKGRIIDTPMGKITLSLDYRKSAADEIDMWRTVVEVPGSTSTKRLLIRDMVPEIFPYSLKKSETKTVPLHDVSLLPGENYALGNITCSVNFDEDAECLNVFVENFTHIPVKGRVFTEAFLYDLKVNYRHKTKSHIVKAKDTTAEFKAVLKLENVQGTLFNSHCLHIRLYQVFRLKASRVVGQTVIKLNKPKEQ